MNKTKGCLIANFATVPWWGNYVDAARRQALLGAEEPLQIVEGE
nr:hypothetical protein [Salmonella sp. S105-04183]